MEGVAVITGGTKGLGLAMVERWLEEGWHVATCARSDEEIQQLISKHGTDRFTARQFDVAQEEDVAQFFGEIGDRFGRIDVLINNASVLGDREPIETYSGERWREVIDVNLHGTFYCARAAVPLMRQLRCGVIINVSSGAGINGKRRWGAYAASKFAVEGFTQVLRDEVMDEGIRVHAVDPGAMQTEMRREAYPDEDIMKHPTPERIARVMFDIAVVYEPQLCRLSVRDYL
jgi:NAD(P)-dependent dehydrogenase (short-subunit alcohol dehydrogenase family)